MVKDKKPQKKKVVKKKADKKDYRLIFRFNSEEHTLETNDIAEALNELAPTFLKTRIFYTVEKDGKKCEGILSVPKGKMLFRNKVAKMVFINRLIFK